jgi:hypothetical protein
MAARSAAVTNVQHFPAARNVHRITSRMSKAVNYVNVKVCKVTRGNGEETIADVVNLIFMPPFKEGRAYCFGAICRSVGLSVCWSTSSFHSFSLHWLHILKWNFVCRFNIRMCRSSFVLGTIAQFLTELWPFEL